MSRQSQERFLRTSDDYDYAEKKVDDERLSMDDPLGESALQPMHVFDAVGTHALDPRNWPNWKRHFTALVIAFYTCAVYSGSSIVMLSIIDLMGKHSIGQEHALASLSLYVLGYGLGPLIWAPLSEIRWIGRKPVYVVTILAFVPISYGASWASDKNMSLFLLLRFLQGYFGSPCLANGGASMHDLYSELELPYALGLWIAFAYAGPALGPAMAANGYDAYGFTFPLYFVFYLSIPAAILLCIAPETYLPKIIYSRGNYQRVAEEEGTHFENETGIVQQHESVWATIKDSLIKPLEISMLDPSVNFVNGYSSALYCFFYSYFDALPLIFLGKYGWSMSAVARACTFIMLGCAIGCASYFWYVHKVANPAARAGNYPQEDRLKPAILAAAAIPVGILIFAFATIDGSVYWMVSMIGLCIYAASVFVILQCLSMYTLKSYPQYAASLFAANDACRSLLAFGGVHAGMPFYTRLGTFWGCVVLAGITALGLPGIYILYRFGSKLRAKSRFAAK